MTHFVVTGLGYGDEGKGTVTDWLCATRDIKTVIRHNGGPQAAHNVVLPDGTHHTFSQFGSGTLRGTRTHLSRHMLVNPFNMAREADAIMRLGYPDPFESTTIAKQALLVTPFHRDANRSREERRGDSPHGTCGQGVGEAVEYHLLRGGDAPLVSDLMYVATLREKLEALRTYYWRAGLLPETALTTRELLPGYRELRRRLSIVDDDWSIEQILNEGDCVFEGAQGVLLDQDYGFHPHTTWSRTTDANAIELLDGRDATRIGVTRTYGTRHGAGPFPGEDPQLLLPELHNEQNGFQGAWRQGRLNLSMLEYAVRANQGVDEIALTHCDQPPVQAEHFGWAVPLPKSRDQQSRLHADVKHAPTYAHAHRDGALGKLVEEIEMFAHANVNLLSFGPTSDHKIALLELAPQRVC